MAFKLVHAKYDRESERAYVELRDEDDDGGEILAVTIFSFRTTARAVEAADSAGYRAQSAPHFEARSSFYLSFGTAGTGGPPPTGHDMVPPGLRAVTFGCDGQPTGTQSPS